MSKLLYDGWHKVELMETVIKGKEVKREKLLIKSAVAGIVVDNEGKIALVKQFRPCTGETLYEIPAGVLDKDKTPLETMIEELEEECELDRGKVASVSMLTEYYMVAGSSDATTKVYAFRYDGIGKDMIVEDADVESVEWFSSCQISKKIKEGIIKDGKTIVAFSLLNSIFN